MSDQVTAPYGSWVSSISVEMLTSGSVGLSAPALDGTDLYWLEARSDQGGRVSLWRRSDNGALVEVTSEKFNVRTRVHEYGGGEYAVDAGIVVFSNFADGRLYRVGPATDPEPMTPEAPLRYGDLRVHAALGLVLAVREDHRPAGEPETTIVALDLDGDNVDGGRVLCSGADFYAAPELTSDGRLAWVQWDHPNMPWDGTHLRVGRLTGGLTGELGAAEVVDEVLVAGGPDESAVHPRWTPSGRLIFVSDRTGWWNLYAWSDDGQPEVTALRPAQAEFTRPPWLLGQHPFVLLEEDRLVSTVIEDGRTSIRLFEADRESATLLSSGGESASSLAVGADRLAAVLTSPLRPSRLALLDLTRLDLTGPAADPAGHEWLTIRSSSDTQLPPDVVSRARLVTWAGELGEVHGWYYPPTNPGVAAPAETLPPLLTLSHGGPTAMATDDFRLGYQFWTSRGIAVLDVNYGGSTGFGRPYRNRLRGAWGIVDVADCVTGAVAMGDQGMADPDRLVICGGSAGGYTTLRALTATDVFAAGISSYGVGDLEALARDTHKFESRYLDGLVGPYPAAIQTYRDRSPVHHVDRLRSPILLLQGADDAVVPPNQAEEMATAVRAKGLPVALIVFPGEGHGFRREETIQAATRAELDFLGRVLGFTPADELIPIQIDNLTASGRRG